MADCSCTNLVCRDCKRDVSLKDRDPELFALKQENDLLKARISGLYSFVPKLKKLMEEIPDDPSKSNYDLVVDWFDAQPNILLSPDSRGKVHPEENDDD